MKHPHLDRIAHTRFMYATITLSANQGYLLLIF